jgi:hypothetical protein
MIFDMLGFENRLSEKMLLSDNIMLFDNVILSNKMILSDNMILFDSVILLKFYFIFFFSSRSSIKMYKFVKSVCTVYIHPGSRAA